MVGLWGTGTALPMAVLIAVLGTGAVLARLALVSRDREGEGEGEGEPFPGAPSPATRRPPGHSPGQTPDPGQRPPQPRYPGAPLTLGGVGGAGSPHMDQVLVGKPRLTPPWLGSSQRAVTTLPRV
jgi:hypothetical protein